MPARIITTINEFETWVSSIDGIVWVRKFDRRGDVVEEQVKPHGKLVISPEERRFNQERVVASENDPFLNGMLLPVKLIETADDYEELRGNPNHLTEEDMRALLAKPKELAALTETLGTISNPATLQRLLSIAEGEEVDATVRQVNVIKERLAEVVVEPTFQEVEVVSGPGGAPAYQSTAPQSPAPRRKSAGRR